MAVDPWSKTKTSSSSSKREPSILSTTIRPVVERSAHSLRLPPISVGETVESGADLVLEGELGAGGMGAVYLARHMILDRDVAVKISTRSSDSSELSAVLNEAKVASRLDHPNIVPIHFVGADPKLGPVVVMKRISGEVWRDRIRAGSDLFADLKVLATIAQALGFAHRRDVIHRDVKPANVMVGEFGEIYLLDWGIAHDLRAPAESSGVVGTPCFMAPEMADGGPIDARTDVYLLGATLHYLVSRRARHEGPSLEEAFEQARRSAPQVYAAEVPPALASICNKACHRSPEQRFQTADEFRLAIEAYIEQASARALLAAADRLADGLGHAIESRAEDSAGLHKRLDRARFAYEQLLEEWPDLKGAHVGHDRAVRVVLDHEVRHKKLSSARALLPLLHHPESRDREGIETVAKELDEEKESLVARARDADVEVGALERYRFIIVCAVVTWMVSVAVVLHGGVAVISPAALTLFAAIGLALTSAVSWRFRERLRESLFNRLLIRVLIGGLIAMTFHRLFGWLGETPVTETLVGDMLIVAACAPCVTPLLRSAIPVTAAALAGASIGTLWPSTALLAFLILISALPVVIALELRGQTRGQVE